MALFNGLGSPSALSLATPQDAVATLVIAGGTLLVAGAVFSYNSWQNYEAKKHRKKMELINEIYKEHLQRIMVPGYDEIRGFPIIFKFNDDKETSTAESMHMNVDEVDAIGKYLPHGNDNLSEYREAVLNAMLKLKEYYFSKKDINSTTCRVLTYLLYMLETKCFNFAGYNYDIAYLNAIANFINAYASIKGTENSTHFSRLQPVYAYVLTAKQLLEKHRDSLSVGELVSELGDCCKDNSRQMIRSFVKLTVKPDHFDLVKTVAHDELMDGKLRKQYVRTEVLGIDLIDDHEVVLPDSIFKDWIKTLSAYYLESLTPDINYEESLISPEKILSFFNKAQPVLKDIQLGKTKSKEAKQLKADLAKIAEVFKNSPNFITTKLDMTKKKPKFIPVTKDAELLECTRVLGNFAKLIHQLISLKYFCGHLKKSIELLGEIYIRNPHHFNKIFGILQNLCGFVLKSVEQVKQEFTTVLNKSNNLMRLEKSEMLPKEVFGNLEATHAIISRLWDSIQDYRDRVVDLCQNKEMRSAKYEMLKVGQSIISQYPEYVAEKPEDKKKIPEKPVEISNSIDEPSLTKPAEGSKKPGEPSLPAKGSPQFVEEANRILDQMIDDLSDRINFIAGEIPKDSKLHAYISLVNQLKIMQNKTEALFNESCKSYQRQEKAYEIAEFTISLCHETLTFLRLSRKDRQAQAVKFARQIHTEIEDADNMAFIDLHNNILSKFLYTNVCQFGIFSTDTRKKLTALDNECQMMAAPVA